MNLSHLTDGTLLTDTKHLASKEREISLKILYHLKEIERRRLFSDLGYSSLFEYAVKELGYSDAAAARRISAARLLRDFPQMGPKIESGTLNLTNLNKAAQLFKTELINDKGKRQEILGRIENKSKKECEKILLSFAEPSPLPKEFAQQVTPEFSAVRMNLSEVTMKLFDEVKHLWAHQRLSQDALMRKVLELALSEIKKKKFGGGKKTTPPAPSPCETTRFIPTSVKREVYSRDQGRCLRCKSTYKLEFDHIVPFSHGGKSNAENLRLLCFSCNQRRNK